MNRKETEEKTVERQTIKTQLIEFIRVSLSDKADTGKDREISSKLLIGNTDDRPPFFTAGFFRSTFVRAYLRACLSWLNKKIGLESSTPGIINHSILEKNS